MGIVAGVLVVIGIAAAAASSGANSNPQPAANTEERSGGAPASSPKASPTQDSAELAHQQVLAYAQAVENNSGVVAAFGAVSNDCGADVAACRADLQNVIDAINKYEAGIDAVTVPQCLSKANGSLRAGLELEKQGAQQAINGIDASDASQINAGTAVLDQGVSEINQATSEIKAANCP